MANRGRDWLEQVKRDLAHAEHARQAGDDEWAAFAAQPAAEKTVKGLLLALGGDGWGYSVLRLLEGLRARLDVHPELLDAARRLDRHYILARYPNGYPAGLPGNMMRRRRSTMHELSSSSAGVRFLDREAALAAIQAAAARAAACPGVLAIYLFGSFASGVPTPRSDADLLVGIADDADRERVRDCCLEAFRTLPVPVDLFVSTDSKVARSLSSGRGLPATVLHEALWLR